ncbi:hypothetical protein RB597_002987 [Gaeumannomyces tritici]
MGIGPYVGSYTGGHRISKQTSRSSSASRGDHIMRAGSDVEHAGRTALPRLTERPWVARVMVTALLALLLFAIIGSIVSCIVLSGAVGMPEMCLAQSFMFFAVSPSKPSDLFYSRHADIPERSSQCILSLLYIIVHLVAARRNLPLDRARALQHPLQSWAIIVARVALVFWLVSMVAVPASFSKLNKADAARIRPGHVDLVVCAFGLITMFIIVYVVESSERPFTLPRISRTYDMPQPEHVTCRISALGLDVDTKPPSSHRSKRSRAGSLETLDEKCEHEYADGLTPLDMVGHEIRINGHFVGNGQKLQQQQQQQQHNRNKSSSTTNSGVRGRTASSTPLGPRSMSTATRAASTTRGEATPDRALPQQPRPTYAPRLRGDSGSKTEEDIRGSGAATPGPTPRSTTQPRLAVPGDNASAAGWKSQWSQLKADAGIESQGSTPAMSSTTMFSNTSMARRGTTGSSSSSGSSTTRGPRMMASRSSSVHAAQAQHTQSAIHASNAGGLGWDPRYGGWPARQQSCHRPRPPLHYAQPQHPGYPSVGQQPRPRMGPVSMSARSSAPVRTRGHEVFGQAVRQLKSQGLPPRPVMTGREQRVPGSWE